jgi:flagellar motor switch protein FliN/FliY
MATSQTLPPPPVAPPRPPDAARPTEIATTDQTPTPPVPPPSAGTGIALSTAIARLPVEVDVSVPVRGFRVRNLLAMEPGLVIETAWAHGEDMPLAAGAVQLAWSEFEVVESTLAVRVTRLV